MLECRAASILAHPNVLAADLKFGLSCCHDCFGTGRIVALLEASIAVMPCTIVGAKSKAMSCQTRPGTIGRVKSTYMTMVRLRLTGREDSTQRNAFFLLEELLKVLAVRRYGRYNSICGVLCSGLLQEIAHNSCPGWVFPFEDKCLSNVSTYVLFQSGRQSAGGNNCFVAVCEGVLV